MGDASLSAASGPGNGDGEPRRRLTFRRLSGLDRSGPPPEQTRRGAPLRPWTIPNAIGFLRLALIPFFLVLAFDSQHGRDTTAAIVFALIGWSDYADGIAARVTGQYSRLGTLMDPLIDRLLVIAGLVVCWHFGLLPRVGIALLVGREALMLVVSQAGVRRGLELSINWLGRAGVWPAMSAPFFAIIGVHELALISLWLGIVLVYGATALYVRDGLRSLRRADAG